MIRSTGFKKVQFNLDLCRRVRLLRCDDHQSAKHCFEYDIRPLNIKNIDIKVVPFNTSVDQPPLNYWVVITLPDLNLRCFFRSDKVTYCIDEHNPKNGRRKDEDDYKTQNDELILPPDLDDLKAPLFEHAVKLDLIRRAEEAKALLKDVDTSEYSVIYLLNAIKKFRHLQRKKSEIKDEDFIHYFKMTSFHSTCISLLGTTYTNYFDIGEGKKPQKYEEALDTITEFTDKLYTEFLEKTHGPVAKIIAIPGVKSATGLYNFGNTCFASACFQILKLNWLDPEHVSSLRGQLPETSLFDYIWSALPPVPGSKLTTQKERDREYELQCEQKKQRALKLAQQYNNMKPEDLLAHDFGGDGLKDISNLIKAYSNLNESFFLLLDQLSAELTEASVSAPVAYQQQFFQALAEYAVASGKYSLQRFLPINADAFSAEPRLTVSDTPPEAQPLKSAYINYRNFSQRDADEFICQIIIELGGQRIPQLNFSERNVTCLINKAGNTVLHQSVKTTQVPYHCIRVPVDNLITSKASNFELSEALRRFCEPERLEASERYTWPDETEQKFSHIPDKGITRQLQFAAVSEAALPVKTLLQVKLFNNECKKLFKKNKNVGLEVLCNVINNNEVIIPTYFNDTKQTRDVKFKVSAVICHSGDTIGSGHYIMLKLTDNKARAVVYDDETATDWKSYIAVNQLDPENQLTSLESFCRYQKLSGYIYLLERDVAKPAVNGTPREQHD